MFVCLCVLTLGRHVLPVRVIASARDTLSLSSISFSLCLLVSHSSSLYSPATTSPPASVSVTPPTSVSHHSRSLPSSFCVFMPPHPIPPLGSGAKVGWRTEATAHNTAHAHIHTNTHTDRVQGRAEGKSKCWQIDLVFCFICTQRIVLFSTNLCPIFSPLP